MATQTSNEQLIITYEDSNDHRIHKYCAAYTEDQAKHYLMKCVERHGRTVNVRIIPAKELHI
jgi:hypothetical protein